MQTSVKKLVVSAPGKLHLLGEHTVVYGQPALLAAVNKRVFAAVSEKESLEKSACRDYIDFCTKKSFAFFNKHQNFSVQIRSGIPIGSGMGSSGATAVAIAGLISKIILGKLDKEKINEIAFACEQYTHGNPSGGDNATSTYGGIIWYQKEKEQKMIKQLSITLSKNIMSKFFMINTGKPEETTKEMVERVKIKNQKSKIKNIIEEQGRLTKQLLDALEKEQEKNILQIIMQAEKNLEALGVVSANTKKIIRKLEEIGAAKVCGAGGKAKASGIVLGFTDNEDQVRNISDKYQIPYESISLGEEGVRVE